jgi:hypothetical protein
MEAKIHVVVTIPCSSVVGYRRSEEQGRHMKYIPMRNICMYVCIRGGLLQPLHLGPQWSIVLNPYDR